MKKSFLLSIIFISFSYSIFSFSGFNQNYFSMNASVEFGLMNGTINEYVFTENCKNTDNMLSRLKWDIRNIPYFEGDLTFNIFKYIFVNANGRIGIPSYSGVMQDYDWLNSVPPTGYMHWIFYNPTELTNYSKHTNEINKYYNFSFKGGFNIPLGKKICLTPFIGYKYDFISMSAGGGYREYKQENFEKIYMSKECSISYAHEMNTMILGFDFVFDLIPYVPMETYFQIVPGVGNLTALDLHFARENGGISFLDKYSSIFQLEWKYSVFFQFDKFNNLGFSSFIQYMPLSKGPSWQGSITPTKVARFPKDPSGATGGAKRFLYSFSIIYQFRPLP